MPYQINEFELWKCCTIEGCDIATKHPKLCWFHLYQLSMHWKLKGLFKHVTRMRLLYDARKASGL